MKFLTRSFADLVRTRTTQARAGDANAVDDLAYAITRLREAEDAPTAPNGRAAVLMDLQQKAQRARETHDPAAVAELSDALLTFLDEELQEALAGDGTPPKADSPPQPTEEEPALTERRTAAEADGYLRYAAAAETPGQDDTRPPADAVPAKEGNMAAELTKDKDAASPATVTCEACGHKNAMPMPLAPATPGATSLMTEADRIAAKRFREENQTLRADNMELRADKQRREMRERCATKIREVGAEGFVQIDDLVTFQESQWPFLLGRIMGPEHVPGGGEPPMPAPTPPATRTSQSAADVFTTVFDA